MVRIGLHIVVALVATALLGVSHAQVRNSPWPPAVQQVSESSPPLSPEEAMKTFYMPPGYSLELVAAEPLVQDPIVFEFDPDGRMWVVEMPAFMLDLPGTNERTPICRVVVLEDTNNDGRMDKRTVFMDNLVLPRAVKVLDSGVLIGEPPNLWLVKDTNKDLRADGKELVTNTFGRLEANPEHNANGLFWGMDNWLHVSEHDTYLRLKNGAFEVAKTLARGQWGVTQDDFGRLYRNTNSAALYVDIVPARYFMRNPRVVRTRGVYESLNNTEVNSVWPVRPNRGANRGYQIGELRPEDGSLARYTGAGAPTIYRGDRLPAELKGNAFIAESVGNLVSRLTISDDGSGLRAARAYERGEFLASTDERFRPVWLSSAPDGTLYVVDMYRGVIQYRDFITEYLRDWIVSHDLVKGVGYGRIYRVVHSSTRRGPRPSLSRATPAALVQTLSHPNGWWRDTAQQLLVQRAPKAMVPALKTLAESAPDPRTKLHALWTLDGMEALDPPTVLRALDDPSRDVRTSALRLAERWLGNPDGPMTAAVLKRLDDADWNVRRQLAATLGEVQAGQKEAAIAQLLERHGDDPITVDAALSGLRGSEIAVLERLLLAPTASLQRETAITMVAATAIRTGPEAVIQKVFDLIAESGRAAWQRAALMRGSEVAVLGAAPPTGAPVQPQARGTGAGPAAGAAPCPTCPGARGGPGGARAFPMTSNSPDTPAPAAAAPQRAAVTLTREPALAAMTGDTSDLGQRASRVLARVEWPGKAGATPASAAAPLTPEQQQRFTAGRELYQARCLACHQEDGRGRAGLATSLVGTPFVTGPLGLPARVLLNGKEGTVGLMPPLGAGMTDEQLAALLTYIRREWGQTASPVDAAAIREVRTQVAGRTRPWTTVELEALANGAQR